jgi:hypothetical protein
MDKLSTVADPNTTLDQLKESKISRNTLNQVVLLTPLTNIAGDPCSASNSTVTEERDTGVVSAACTVTESSNCEQPSTSTGQKSSGTSFNPMAEVFSVANQAA